MRDGDQDRDQLIELHFHLVARIVRGVAARLPAAVLLALGVVCAGAGVFGVARPRENAPNLKAP